MLRKKLIDNKIFSENKFLPFYEKKLKKHKLLYKEVLYATRFLNQYEPSTKERLFCIKQRINNPVLCKYCNSNKVKLTEKNRYNTYCSNECMLLDPLTKEKIKKTNLRKYGVESHNSNKHIKEKKKNIYLKNYQVTNPAKSEQIKEKIKQTNLERYGEEYGFQSKQIKEKIKQTNLERYGVENPQQNLSIRKKTEKTNLKEYGFKCPLENKDIQKKGKLSSFEKYGVTYYIHKHLSEEIIDKLNDSNWLIEQNHIHKKSLSQISNELRVSNGSVIAYHFKKFNIEIKYYNRSYSYKSIKWMEFLMNQHGIYIQHAQNEGEYNIPGTRYYADGYCKQNNTIYEFYGDYYHGNPDIYEPDDIILIHHIKKTAKYLYETTKKREEVIKNKGYNLTVMWESEWNLIQGRL